MSQRNELNAYVWLDAGVLDLNIVDKFLLKLVDKRIHDLIPDTVVLLSYNPCLAVGARQLDERDFLKPPRYFAQQGIPLYKSVRGGGLTYHWPGQLVCYPILKLQPYEQNIPGYMFKLEEIGLATLADEGVQAHRKRDKTAQIGLWVDDDKIASMGIRVSKWVTSYGFALNLSGDVSPAHYIRPCGLDVDLTTVEQHTGRTPDREKVKQRIRTYFEKEFQRHLIDGRVVNEIRDIIDEYSG